MKLNSPFQLGSLALSHRIVMPPLTRMRAGAGDGVPSPFAAAYYAQRATPGGLLIAEASQISRQGQGYPQTPGIYTEQQVEGWRKVVEVVKAKGAHFVLQLAFVIARWWCAAGSTIGHCPEGQRTHEHFRTGSP